MSLSLPTSLPPSLPPSLRTAHALTPYPPPPPHTTLHLQDHFYPNWVGDGQRTQENFSNRCQGDLKGYSHRTFVTETGADLDNDFADYDKSGKDGDVNVLRGLDDCLSALHDGGAPVLGVYPWHGYDNGDSYSFFGAKNGNGRAKLQHIEERS